MGGVDSIDLVQDRDTFMDLGNTVMKPTVPQHAGKFSAFWGTVSFSRRILLHGVCAETGKIYEFVAECRM
jgi:hypothetical protein